MALVFPLAVDAFFSALKIRSTKFTLLEFILTSGTPENMMTAEIHGALWTCEIATPVMATADAVRASALLRRVGAHNRFMCYDKAHAYPAYDPTGSIVAGSTVTVSAVGSDNRSLRLAGLPSGYRLGWGDKVQVSYGSGTTRHELFEVNDDIVVPGSGTTPLFEVTPPLRAGIAAGNAAFLRRPSCQMQFQNYDVGTSELRLAAGMTFQAIEVIV